MTKRGSDVTHLEGDLSILPSYVGASMYLSVRTLRDLEFQLLADRTHCAKLHPLLGFSRGDVIDHLFTLITHAIFRVAAPSIGLIKSDR
jgi:hypothetical protein